ncbi:MAG TPA: diacylglycerol kinase [Planctomycetaceae bacterium]|nr:diacylglycerol kinase [Planctomycetaceae bacterium]
MPQLLEPPLHSTKARRAPWRQRLVETERGLAQGFRGDSTLFFHLFVDCTLLAVGGVLDLSLGDWLLVGLALTVVLSAELMQQAVRVCIAELRSLRPEGQWDRALHLATAAVGVAFTGSAAVIGLIYWQRIRELYWE